LGWASSAGSRRAPRRRRGRPPELEDRPQRRLWVWSSFERALRALLFCVASAL